MKLDKRFVDKASGKDLHRPQLELLIGYVREAIRSSAMRWTGWPVTWTICERSFLGLTERGVHVRFEKENLTFKGEDSPMSHLLLSVMGPFASSNAT